MWLKSNTGNAVNIDAVAYTLVEQVSSDWVLNVYTAGGLLLARLNGTWSTQAAAQDALSELFQVVDSGTY